MRRDENFLEILVNTEISQDINRPNDKKTCPVWIVFHDREREIRINELAHREVNDMYPSPIKSAVTRESLLLSIFLQQREIGRIHKYEKN